jgi:hypothetical protein
MASRREILELVKPLLEEDDALHYADLALAVAPFRHFVAYIELGVSQSSLGLTPYLSFMPTLLASPLNVVIPSGREIRPSVWMDEVGYPEDLRDSIRNEYAPFLKARNATFDSCAEAFEEFYPQHTGFIPRGVIAIMTGDFAECARRMHGPAGFVIVDYFDKYFEGLGTVLRDKGDTLSLRDKRRLIALMQGAEAEAAKKLRIDKRHWEPSLFPAEITYPELRVLRPDGTVMDD